MSIDAFPHYQTLEKGTEGEPGKANRSIPDRIIEYGIDKVVTKESTVLDLGCNRGYFGICLSPYIGHYTGVESSLTELQYGANERAAKGYHNINFYNAEYNPIVIYGAFDIIICTAFHIYCGVSMDNFGSHLIAMLKPGGHLFLEGHPKGYHLPHNELKEPEGYWEPLTAELDKSLRRVEEKTVKDRTNLRPFIHYQK